MGHIGDNIIYYVLLIAAVILSLLGFIIPIFTPEGPDKSHRVRRNVIGTYIAMILLGALFLNSF